MDITAIMTLKVMSNSANKHYSGNASRAQILLKSVRKFAPQAFKEIILICPQDEIKDIATLIIPFSTLNIRIVDENSLLPRNTDFQAVHNWYKQQICKIASTAGASTEAVLQLDPDMIVRRPLTNSQFFAGGKLLTQTEATSHRADRWIGAASLLKFTDKMPDFGLSVTPALLAKSVCKELLDQLGNLYSMDPLNVLIDNAPRDWKRTWTEYSLYTLAAIKANLWTKYHAVQPDDKAAFKGQAVMISGSSVWMPEQAKGLTSAAIFSREDPGFFFVFQSATGIEAETYSQLVDTELASS